MEKELPEAPLVRRILSRIASELNEPRINQDLELILTDKDFDNRQRSILDTTDRRIVVKVSENDLHDYETTPTVRRKVDTNISEVLRIHYATKKKAAKRLSIIAARQASVISAFL